MVSVCYGVSVLFYDTVRCGMVRYCILLYGMVWCVCVCHACIIWCGMACYGMIWYGIVWYIRARYSMVC